MLPNLSIKVQEVMESGACAWRHECGAVEKRHLRRSHHFPVLTYRTYAPRAKMAAALLDGLF